MIPAINFRLYFHSIKFCRNYCGSTIYKVESQIFSYSELLYRNIDRQNESNTIIVSEHGNIFSKVSFISSECNQTVRSMFVVAITFDHRLEVFENKWNEILSPRKVVACIYH